MSSPSRDEIKQAAASKQGDIRIEKDSTAYAEYHPIERPAGVSNTGSMKYAQLVSFFDNITNEKNVSMRSLKLAKLFDVCGLVTPAYRHHPYRSYRSITGSITAMISTIYSA